MPLKKQNKSVSHKNLASLRRIAAKFLFQLEQRLDCVAASHGSIGDDTSYLVIYNEKKMSLLDAYTELAATIIKIESCEHNQDSPSEKLDVSISNSDVELINSYIKRQKRINAERYSI
jgi:hypothetical protein